MLWQVCVSNQCVCNSSTLCSNEGNSDVFSGACCQGDRFLISFSTFFFFILSSSFFNCNRNWLKRPFCARMELTSQVVLVPGAWLKDGRCVCNKITGRKWILEPPPPTPPYSPPTHLSLSLSLLTAYTPRGGHDTPHPPNRLHEMDAIAAPPPPPKSTHPAAHSLLSFSSFV